jgi:hypothetical protein
MLFIKDTKVKELAIRRRSSSKIIKKAKNRKVENLMKTKIKKPSEKEKRSIKKFKKKKRAKKKRC